MVANVETMFSGRGKVAWHGIGNVVEGLATASEALELSGLDWTVSKRSVGWTSEDGVTSGIPGQFALMRDTDDQFYGFCTDEYNIYQNAECFDFMDNLVDSGEAKYDTAGSLANGRRVFLTALVGEGFTVRDADDKIETYLVVTTSHDAKQSLVAAVATVRVVCQNTLTMALSGAKSKWTLRHKNSLTGKIEDARSSLGIALKYQDAMQDEIDRLLDVEVTKDEFKNILDNVLPDQARKKDRSLDEILAVWASEPTVVDYEGATTGYGAMNAFTFWADHIKESRSAEARFKTITEGQVANLRSDLRDGLLALA